MTRDEIFKELVSDGSDVRSEYVALFEQDAKAFSSAMEQAASAWRSLERDHRGEEKRAYVAAFVYNAITLHIGSFQLFLSGHIVAAGNLTRQTLEAIAMALLCSHKELNVLDRFMKQEYSTNKAVDQLLSQADKLSLIRPAVETLRSSRDFYHQYSHFSKMTIAASMSLADSGNLYFGGSFDKGKVDAYRKEVDGRVSLAKVFPNIIEGVRAHYSKW